MVKPRAIVFDLFGDHLRYLGGSARMHALSELLEVFDVGLSTTRVVLSRMRKEGWFDTQRDGRQTVYSLTEQSWRLLDQGRTRIFHRSSDRWDGSWRMVIYAVPEQARAERERLRRTLTWHGFGPLAAATWISPHPRLDQVEAALAEMPTSRLDLLTCRSRGRSADREMAGRCWDLEGLGRDFAELVSSLEQLPPGAELAALPGPKALRRRWSWYPPTAPFLSVTQTYPPNCYPRAGRVHGRSHSSSLPTTHSTNPRATTSGRSSSGGEPRLTWAWSWTGCSGRAGSVEPVDVGVVVRRAVTEYSVAQGDRERVVEMPHIGPGPCGALAAHGPGQSSVLVSGERLGDVVRVLRELLGQAYGVLQCWQAPCPRTWSIG